jgi:glycosyltransferase involved in cell wall biosynthesis
MVIPAHNEAAYILGALRDLATALPKLGVDFEVIVVDDGSTDDTCHTIELAFEDAPWLRVESQSPARGKGGALEHGFSVARGDVIAFVDADGQIPGQEIEGFLRTALAQPYAVHAGVRRGRRPTLHRRLISVAYRILCRVLLGIRTRDTGCPLKAFPHDFIATRPPLVTGWVIDAQLLAHARTAGLEIVETPVRVCDQERADSNVRTLDALRSIGDLVAIRRELRTEGPMKQD